MAKQRIGQGTKQQLRQRQRLTPQQLLVGQLIEKPIDLLEDYVSQQLIDNPALEVKVDDEPWDKGAETHDSYDDNEPLPVYDPRPRQDPSTSLSFYDNLREQMGESTLTDRQRTIMEYLIGSLDNDGLLHKDIGSISDEMAIYHNFEATEEEISEVLRRLQEFDPPGVGAQSRQQCLLLQVERRGNGWVKDMLHRIIANYFDDLMKNHWPSLQKILHLSDEEKETLRAEVRKLNPKPGAALSEVQGLSIHQVTPDFIVETNDFGEVTFTLQRGRLPALEVSEAYMESINSLQSLSQRDKARVPELRRDIENAKMLIEALHQRQLTLTKTMSAIIHRQRKFFLDGDEADLKPMALKDIAADTGLDISTISRVTNEKYAETQWGILRLRFFFSDRYDNAGEEISTRAVKSALRDIIDHEDKQHPFTDQQLEQEMRTRGFQTRRRTIVKYREQMGIPKSSLRRQ